MADYAAALFLLISGYVSTTHASECYGSYSYLNYDTYYYNYCPFGCCGNYGNEYCCTYTGPVVGIVFGMIAFISLIIALIICRRRRWNTSGVIVRTGGVPNAGFVSTTTMQQSGTMMHTPPTQYPVPSQYPAAQHYAQPPPYGAPKY